MEKVRTVAAVVSAAALIAILVQPFIGDTWQFTIESWSDYEIKSKLEKAGRDGWSIASCRRAVTDGFAGQEGVYECIMQKRR